MEKVLTVEVNLNLKADESLQRIVAYIFGQKLTADNERNPQPATEQPNPEPQPTDPELHTDADDHKEPALDKPKRTRSKKVDPAPATDPQPAEQPTEQLVEQPTEQPAGEVSLEEIKQVFFTKLAGHRDEIRAKINELGAPSLSLIAPEKRSEMLEFLKGLD